MQAGEFLTDVEDHNDNPCLLWARYPGDSIISDYVVTWEREIADQYLFGSPAFFALLAGV